jgi:hypothetical protein
MNVARIARFLEFVGLFVPSVFELTLLVPGCLALYYVARALDFEVDLEPELVMGISVTFAWFLWVTLNSWCYRGAEHSLYATSQEAEGRNSLRTTHRSQPLDAFRTFDRAERTESKQQVPSMHGS